VTVSVLIGDCIESMRGLPAGTFQTCVTSPPYYGLRDYGVAGQIGLEKSPDAYVARLVDVFREVRRVLRDDGTLWLNLGDSYYSGNGKPCGSDPRSASRNWMRERLRPLDTPGWAIPKKSLLGVPWLVAHALQRDGWTVRAEIVWCRETALAEPSVRDRPHRQHETVFLLSRSRWYFFDRFALPEETVWHIPHRRGLRGHSAAFPDELAQRCIKAGSRPGDRVLDPFGGAGTTALVADRLGRHATICELNPEYARLARERITADAPLLAAIA
jgi:site-specific DNA-methyltransferase (adenine-specific)